MLTSCSVDLDDVYSIGWSTLVYPPYIQRVCVYDPLEHRTPLKLQL